MERKRKIRKFILNNDGGDHPYMYHTKPDGKTLAKAVIDPIANTQVDTLFYEQGVGNTVSYQSDVLPIVGEYNDFNFTDIYAYKTYMHLRHCVENGIDNVGVVVDEAHARGIDIFYTFRINDVHDMWDSCVDLKPLFKKEHPEWQHKPYAPVSANGMTKTQSSLDFSVKEVRDLKLRAAAEILDKWDIDGLELDLMRDNAYFDGNAPTLAYCLTDWIRQVRKLTDGASQKRGRYIELAVRVPLTLVNCTNSGMDVELWAKEGLVDIVTAAVGGNAGVCTDTAGFKKAFEGTDVGFFTCLNGCYSTRSWGIDRTEDEILRGVSEQLWAGKPDGIYTFNLFPYINERIGLLSEIGSPETLRGLDKTYIVDMASEPGVKHLPLKLGETVSEPARFEIAVGEDFSAYESLKSLKLKIYMPNVTELDEIDVYFNGRSLGTYETEFVRYNASDAWSWWNIGKNEVKAKNEVAIHLRKRNPYLKKFNPLEVMEINLEVRF